MSDNTPITGELRELLADISWTEIIDHMQMNSGATLDCSWLDSWRAAADRACDAIDAIHANLERENESLRRELDRVMGEQDHDGWVELPKDADGEYVHVGDMLAGEKVGGFGLCEPFEVGCILFGKDIIRVNDVHGLGRCTEFAHHYRPDTWERIIEDAKGRYSDADTAALVARCRALAGE